MKYPESAVFIASMLLLFNQAVRAAAPSAEGRIIDHVLKGYDRLALPVRQTDEAVKVKFGVSLIEVLHLDDSNGQIAVKMWLRMMWHDPHLVWDSESADGEGINKLYLPPNKIWTPDITLFNEIDSDFIKDLKVVVTPEGEVTYVRAVVYTVTCRHEFRGNSWICPFKFGSWVYDGYHMDMVPFGEVVDVNSADFARSDHWSILEHTGSRDVKVYECCPEPYISMEFVVKLRNKIGPSLLGRRRK